MIMCTSVSRLLKSWCQCSCYHHCWYSYSNIIRKSSQIIVITKDFTSPDTSTHMHTHTHPKKKRKRYFLKLRKRYHFCPLAKSNQECRLFSDPQQLQQQWKLIIRKSVFLINVWGKGVMRNYISSIENRNPFSQSLKLNI